MFGCFFAFAMVGCQKEKGCLDERAINYNPEADISGEECRFHMEVSLWYTAQTADSLLANGVDTLILSMYHQIQRSVPVEVGGRFRNCENDDQLLFIEDVQRERFKIPVAANSSNGGWVWLDGVWYEEGTCESLEVVWE